MIKPFIRWAGGKQNLVRELLKNAPDHRLIGKYYEPFLGAGSFFFANGFENAFLSDVNEQLINSYKQIQKNYTKIHKLIKMYETKFLKNENFYYILRLNFNKNLKQFDYIQAARFIFLLHTNYNGIYRLNKKGEYNVPIGRRRPILPNLTHLESISKKLNDAKVVSFNYFKILKLVKKNDFIYLDPPYPPLNWNNHLRQYTIDKFTKEKHEELAQFAKKLSKRGCYVLISNTDNDFIRNLYDGWTLIELQSNRSISCKRERKKFGELIIKNY